MCGIVEYQENSYYTYTLGLNNFMNLNPKMHFDIIDIIDEEKFYCRITESLRTKIETKIKKQNKNTLIKSIGTSSETLRRILIVKDYWINLKTLFLLCAKLGFNKELIKENMSGIKTKNSMPIYVKLISLNKEFSRIVGHVLGDGGIHINEKEGKFRIFYVNNDQVLLDTFKTDVNSIFPNTELYSRQRSDRGDEIWLPTTIGIILFKIFNMYDCKTRRVPEFIFNTTKSNMRVFLQAMFDDEGTVSVDKHGIILDVSNRELLNDIKCILSNLEIQSMPIKLIIPKNRSRMFRLSIYGKDNILKFYRKIGFLDSFKKNKLELLASKYEAN